MVRRRLFNFAVVVSLILGTATLVLWIRSRTTKDRFSCTYGYSLHLLASRHGAIGYQRLQMPTREPWSADLSSRPADAILFMGIVGEVDSVRSFGEEPSLELLGAELTPRLGIYFVPHWMPLLAFAGLPACRATAIIRRRRAGTSGRCTTCGYDLRATPDRCPECGSQPPDALDAGRAI